jgi:hypothetical protein
MIRLSRALACTSEDRGLFRRTSPFQVACVHVRRAWLISSLRGLPGQRLSTRVLQAWLQEQYPHPVRTVIPIAQPLAPGFWVAFIRRKRETQCVFRVISIPAGTGAFLLTFLSRIIRSKKERSLKADRQFVGWALDSSSFGLLISVSPRCLEKLCYFCGPQST